MSTMSTYPILNEFYASGDHIPRHRIAYTEWGDPNNDRILMCVHGLTRNARDFDFLAQALSPYYRVICIDVAGRGRSEWLSDSRLYNYGTYINDILCLFQHLNIERVDWVGTSMGGLIGMIMSAEYPHLIGKMVLNDIGPFVSKEPLKRIARYISTTPEFADLEQAEKHLRTKLAPFGISKDEHWRYITLHSVISRQDGSLILAYDPLVSKEFIGASIDNIKDIDLWPVWEKITISPLIIRGGESDILTKDVANKMLASKQDSKLVEFSGIGHAPALMDDYQINTIKEWLVDK